MRLTNVLTATDTNPLYYKFVPIFVKTWKKLFPDINIHIILISDTMIPELEPYSKYIKLFPPIPNVKSSFIAQNIRLLYPCLIKSEGGILITDMDIIPMNRDYYTEPIKNISDDKFVCYRQLECVGKNEMVICYNIAHRNVWRSVFSIKTEADIVYMIQTVLYNNMEFVGHKEMPFWITDQLYLFNSTQNWNKNVNVNKLVILNDNFCKFKRLDRGNFPNSTVLSNSIQTGQYSDYHMCRPYDKYKQINDNIVNLL
tara:strand:+ start:5545 stop:6312 length:768 start_codon:yes stop_codon:yes gene_type:complete